MTTLGSTMQRFLRGRRSGRGRPDHDPRPAPGARARLLRQGRRRPAELRTITALDSQVGEFQQKTGKRSSSSPLPSLDGQTLDAAAAKTFSRRGDQRGVLIFIARTTARTLVLGDPRVAGLLPAGHVQAHQRRDGHLVQSRAISTRRETA